MPGPKKQTPAPIDRPLSRAYLREFTGWSTAFPPGLSDPTSLRIMENTQINRDGSMRVRPGLRYLSYSTLPTDDVPGIGNEQPCVGTHEAFFLNDGTKAYLFAVREDDGTVGFRVLALTDGTSVIHDLSEDFAVPQGEPALNFSAETTYVKYLQIDNKIFALSNAGETMRLFTVGAIKEARKLPSIDRPHWDLVDKLTVLEPDAAWITAGVPTGIRINLAPNSGFGANTGYIAPSATSQVRLTTAQFKSGITSLEVKSKPTRTNYIHAPLHNVAADGVAGWIASTGTATVQAIGANMRVTSGPGSVSDNFYVRHQATLTDLSPSQAYYADFNLAGAAFLANIAVLVRFYNGLGKQVGSDQVKVRSGFALGRQALGPFTAPAGAVSALLYIRGTHSSTVAGNFSVREITFTKSGEPTTIFSGDSGTGYYWEGGDNTSASVYQPDGTVSVLLDSGACVPTHDYAIGVEVRGDTVARSCSAVLRFYDSSDTLISSTAATTANDSISAWSRKTRTLTAPAGAVKMRTEVSWAAVPRGELHFIDELISIEGTTPGTFFNGNTTDTTLIKHTWDGVVDNSASRETTYTIAGTIPTAETPTANTLIDSTAADNVYSFGYFYTAENEVGESAASQVTVIKAQRAWSQWKWQAPDASGNPTGADITDPTLCADQLVAYMPQAVYDTIKAQGAKRWNLYMLTWSNEDSVPVEGLLLESKEITPGGTYGVEGWIRHTPANNDSGFAANLPSINNRHNYSEPSSAGQGVVAADRMVLVDDPLAQAVIRWSSNLQGQYTNFTASKGGGYKTLTSGNLFVPVAVKLWQNPQSVDTLTILCSGLDGANTAYYMAPATVSSQSEQTNVMGFEETTASPGTTSPYGCEVLNNALYHPIDEMLMKSTASNYNISHKSQTDQVQDRWSSLANKHRIVSSQHDNRLYYIVHNPLGAAVDAGCMGNEIWVYDIASDKGTWSRWLIPATSLRRIEAGGKVFMSVVRPDGIFYLDPDYDRDDFVDSEAIVGERFIPWRIETNTQGANRAHDAWSHLQQLTISLGNFLGTMEYGIRGWDDNGKNVERVKRVHDNGTRDEIEMLPWDRDDHLQVKRNLKEWYFFARSVEDAESGVYYSTGQIDAVQYRYTPVSVNVGYEYGSIETFEYGRAYVNAGEQITDDGVPKPMMELRRP